MEVWHHLHAGKAASGGNRECAGRPEIKLLRLVYSAL